MGRPWRGGAWRHRTAWRGSVADTGGAAVSLPCCGAGTSGARRRLVTRASGAAAEGEREKGGAAVGHLVAGRGGALRASGEARKGKADKRAPLVSCPGRKVKGCCGEAGRMGWAAACGLCYLGRKGEREVGWAVR
jgi:hypothetical protein